MFKVLTQSRRAHLAAITLGALVFAATLLLTIVWSINSAIGKLEQTSAHKLSLYQQILSSEVKRHEFLPYALARNQSILELIRDQHDERLVARVNRYLEEVSRKTSAAAVYVMNADGLTLASSNWRSAQSYVGHNYGFRPYFQSALGGKAGHYFAVGVTTFVPGLFLSYPIESGGRIVGVVALKLSLDSLETEWAGQPAEKVLVADSNGVIISSSEPNWKFHTLAPLPPRRIEELRRSRQFAGLDLPPLGLNKVSWLSGTGTVYHVDTLPRTPPLPQFHLLGLDFCYLATGTALPDSGWTLYLFSDMAPVEAGMINSLAIFGPTALAMALAAFYLIELRFYTRERRAYQARAKAELEASEARKRAVIQSTRAALVTIDEIGRIESINPTAEHFFGLAASEVEGRSFKELLFPDVHPLIDAYLERAGGGRGEDFTLETRGRRRDGNAFFIDLIVSDLFPHAGSRYLATIHNITKRKAAEENLHRILDEQEGRIRTRTAELETSNRQLQHEIVERERAEEVLRQAQDELIQAGKLAALGQMSTGITHELNQPLTAIRTFAASGRLLLERGQSAEAGDNFGRIEELTARMATLTTQLKVFARKSSGKRAPVSVAAAVRQALALVEHLITRNHVEVELDLPADEGVQVLADQLRLEQVLINLFSNAADAMKAVSRRRLQIAVAADDAHVQLRVADTGIGIDPQVLPQIFDPFFTTKAVGEGLGLGLSIAFGIIRDWGGTLAAENLETGARFTVTLPCHSEGSRS